MQMCLTTGIQMHAKNLQLPSSTSKDDLIQELSMKANETTNINLTSPKCYFTLAALILAHVVVYSLWPKSNVTR